MDKRTMATKKYNKKNKNYSNTSVKQKLFFAFTRMTILWPPHTMTCDEQNAHVEKVQRNNHEISRPFIKPMNTERVLWVHHPTIKSHRDTTI